MTMRQIKVGLIGYGEIGSTLGAGLRAQGLEQVSSFDIGAFDGPYAALIQGRAARQYGPEQVAATVAARDAMCPSGKMGDAWDVAHAALFLASDDSSYVNGHALVVDGGLSSSHPFNNQSYGRTAI